MIPTKARAYVPISLEAMADLGWALTDEDRATLEVRHAATEARRRTLRGRWWGFRERVREATAPLRVRVAEYIGGYDLHRDCDR